MKISMIGARGSSSSSTCGIALDGSQSSRPTYQLVPTLPTCQLALTSSTHVMPYTSTLPFMMLAIFIQEGNYAVKFYFYLLYKRHIGESGAKWSTCVIRSTSIFCASRCCYVFKRTHTHSSWIQSAVTSG